ASDRGVTTIVGTVNLDLAANLYGYLVVDDLSSFVHRDYSIVQSPHTIMGWVDHATGDYEVDLPIVPHGTVNNLGHGQGGEGVQVYSVDSYYDAVHDPRPGPWESGGWAWSDSSISSRQGDHEVTGGRVLVWAPDEGQLVS